ncbi:helicase SRCAP-like isoform X4 [Anomalospiza imberbis]|uniref:helicase SRCAP-like isoform X4 n=1 Tax=Anomalospiza imberbis TaxID=187417 RepID=UPI00358E54E5
MTGSSPVSPASSSGGSPGSPSPPGPPRPAPPPEGPPEGPPGPPEPPWLWERSPAEIAEQAKHEAEVEHRVAEMKREGFWSLRRLPKVPEPARPKVHWDYLCEEMQWLAADFAQERRWKRGVARKVVRMVMRHHEEQRQRQERAKREEQAKLRRVAAAIAREVRHFWSSVEKVVQFKQQSRLEEKRKKALDLQLDFIVGQTERYSDLLSRSLNAPRPRPALTCAASAESPPRPLGDLLGSLPPQVLRRGRDPPPPWGPREEDEEFEAEEEEGEDEEDTIAAQERLEGDVDHQQELDDLAREGALPMEELLQRYRGAFTDSDCDSAPGASSTRSDSPGGDSEEEEEEEDDDDEDEDEDEADDEDEEEEGEGQEGGGGAPGEPGGGVAPPAPAQVNPAPAAPAGPAPKKEISDIAAAAESLQPKGYTLATTQVKTPIPHLLRGTLREYQHIGLDWLVTMYEKKLNGILADEMGLGKTIQTISLLAHLACEKGSWGPHLIIVPTSVMLNWEMELKRWCPSFKILTYYGAQKERRLKRQGWTKPNAFHVCITSYKLVLPTWAHLGTPGLFQGRFF